MQAPVACEIQAWGSFEQLSGAQPSAWIWTWSWDPLKLMRRHPPHHLSPAWAKHPAGLDPEAGLGRSKSPQQRSVQAGKPVNSEQVSCSFSSIALTPNASRSRESTRLEVLGALQAVDFDSTLPFAYLFGLPLPMLRCM